MVLFNRIVTIVGVLSKRQITNSNITTEMTFVRLFT